jgi:hypothetical protein
VTGRPGPQRGEFPTVRIRNRLIVLAKALDVMADAALAEPTAVDAVSWTVRR